MSPLPKVGDRIRLIEMPNDPRPVPPGSEGVVFAVTNLDGMTSLRQGRLGQHQIVMRWDAGVGRSLNLIHPIDQFDILSSKET